MSVVGKTDAFERRYMGEFRQLASEHGEFVSYERDRGVRDIGLHLTHKLESGVERLSSSLCWFQMKGITESRFPKEKFEAISSVSISLKVEHLRYWFLQPMPTYLVIYVECSSEFLVIDIQKYVTNRWGRDILSFNQESVSVPVSKESVLDEQAFSLILVQGDLAEWQKALGAEEDSLKLCRRDYSIIWHLGTATERKVTQRMIFWDWQSKTRGQLYIQERPIDSNKVWDTLREHWQFGMNVSDLEDVYPYIEFGCQDDADWIGMEFWFDEYDPYGMCEHTFSTGNTVRGIDACGEYFEYQIPITLNETGQELFFLIHTGNAPIFNGANG